MKCGSAQAAEAERPGMDDRPEARDFQTGYAANNGGGLRNSKTAALLCYIPWFGWIAAIIVLASRRYRRDYEVRFHAFQGLYLFVTWLLVDWVVSPVLRMTGYGFWQPLPRGGGVLHLVILAGWIVMLVKVGQGQHYRLPILGDLAERSVAEQRVG